MVLVLWGSAGEDGHLEELRRTAAIVRATGISI